MTRNTKKKNHLPKSKRTPIHIHSSRRITGKINNNNHDEGYDGDSESASSRSKLALLQVPICLTKPSSLTFLIGVVLSSICYYHFFGDQIGLQNKQNNVTSSNCSYSTTDTTSTNITVGETFPTCGLYVAKSTISNSGLGIFTTNAISRGGQVGPADIVIQLPDPNQYFLSAIRVLAYDYLWDGQETGGQYEGQKVFSVVPGIGMLANGHAKDYNTIQSSGAKVDTAGLHRSTHAGAGANSHYWNYSFSASRDIPAGSEILVSYGLDWFNERKEKEILDLDSNQYDNGDGDVDGSTSSNSAKSIDWLRQNGICLDNIKVGQSSNPEAGRGAFATRSIAKGQIVAPAPVVQITERRILELLRVKTNSMNQDLVERTEQLLLNYCFGHRHSSILLLPIAPLVNFINHDSNRTNVELRWSTSSQHDLQHPEEMSIQDLKDMKHAGLMLEFVATRDIQEDDEIFLNYGERWEEAWKAHILKWQPIHSDVHHTYATVFDDMKRVIKTQREQQNYPDNLFTSCYYNYRKGGDIVRWKMTNTTMSDRNLRPCVVLDRHTDADGVILYTVGIQNRYGLAKDKRIPSGKTHVVTHVPRWGIKFTNKLFTTDQSLATAFRHEISLPDLIFPKKWLDL